MDLTSATTTDKRWGYAAYLNMGLWAIAVAVMLRLWRAGDLRFWRVMTPAAPAAVDFGTKDNDESSSSRDAPSTDIPLARAHAFVQSPTEQSIVLNIHDFEEDPAVAVYDVEIKRRHHHH